jgi:endonuclease-3
MSGKPARPALPTIIERLREKYPEARYELNWETPLQLLMATILATQSTDERINRVTPGLFARYPDARAFAEAPLADLELDLKPTGFYRNKARAVQGACQALVERFGGKVPRTMEELTSLPGVARKTANVVLGALILLSNQIGDEGALALAASPYLENLAELKPLNNHIGAAGVTALRERFGKRVRIY